MTMRDVSYTVVVPVFNSDDSVRQLTNRLHDVFQNVVGGSYEIILIDDCSSNRRTWQTLTDLSSRDERVRSFRLARNTGQGAATMCGLSMARGAWVVTMDDDLQQRPEDIPLLLAARHHDVVIARFPAKRHSWARNLASGVKGRLDYHLLGKPQDISSTSFKLLSRTVVDAVLRIRTQRPFMIAQILAITDDIVNVDVEHQERVRGGSQYTVRKMLSLISNLLINNSSFLLRAMAAFGLVLSFATVTFGTVLIVRKLMNPDVPVGWTSVFVAILFSTGAIVFCLGVVGEYIYRVLNAVEQRPSFTIQASVDRAHGDDVESGSA